MTVTFTTQPTALNITDTSVIVHGVALSQGSAPPDAITWVEPPTRTDGSALVQIDYYTVEYGAIGQPLSSEQVTGAFSWFLIPGMVQGTTYRARISATDVNGKTSQFSGFAYMVAP